MATRGGTAAGESVEGPPIGFLHLARAGRKEPGCAVVTTAAEWERLWSELWQPGERPAVDFSRYVVLAVFAGEKPTGGYRVDIVAVRAAVPDIDAVVRQDRPRADQFATLAFTYPGHLVLVERQMLESLGVQRVRFRQVDGDRLADLPLG